jgi:hypothetical protein
LNNETSTLDSIIEEVRRELRSMLVKRRKLIERLGFTFERVVANPESICEEIKTTLRDEIAEKAISSRDIERYCPDKWKKKTKPQKNDNLSFQDILEQGSQKKVVISTVGTSLEEPSHCGSDSASRGNNCERDVPSSFQSQSAEKYIQHGHGYGQLPEDLVRYELQHINNDSYGIEFSLPFNDVQSYASSTFKLNGGINNLWFNCVIDKKTGKVLSAGVGRLDSCSELDSRGAPIARDE